MRHSHGWGRAGNHTGTEAQGGFCAGVTGASQGSSGRWVPGHFSEVPFKSGKVEEMAAQWVVQRGHSYLYSVLSPSSGAVTYLIIFIIFLLSTGWTFFLILSETRQEHRLFKVTVFKGFLLIIVLSFNNLNSSGLNNIAGLFDYCCTWNKRFYWTVQNTFYISFWIDALNLEPICT